MKKNTRLILALDVTDRESALKIAQYVHEYVDAIKVGYPLVLATGLGIVKDLAQYAPVIADFKVADIPNTDRLICEQVFKAGADAVIVHGFTGQDSLDACVGTAKASGKDIYVVTEMSHPGGVEFFRPVAEVIAKMALDAGASGVVAPATRPERVSEIRSIIGSELSIISPGVGAQGGSAADVIKAGADWVIVGRSI
ncbi:MAG: orotidine-5'-phosphate decarboxylase, partial [Methanosarcinaceae archaeon]|nr:orotidine-5'-phosphate decarboxylase [Methanosarcinaceae archaeon]